MRFDGVLKSWNEERGFGFIQPLSGGQDVFVHIKAFDVIDKRPARPQAGLRLTFEVMTSADGRKRAQRVRLLQPTKPSRAPRTTRLLPSSRPARPSHPAVSSRGPAPASPASYFSIPAFLLIYLVSAVLWGVPHWVGGWYLVASLMCFIAYAVDKSAAAAGRWRISEAHLLLIGLMGGWPGAVLAQQVLRHKSSKAAFRSSFWGSVLLNVGGFIVLSSPLGSQILDRLTSV